MATDRPGPLALAAARKHDATVARAGDALRELDRAGDAINFQAVARAGGVSRQWLYGQADLRREIEQLRTSNGKPGSAVPAGQRASEASLRQRIRSLLDENHRLRVESDGLRAELALAYGERRDPRRDS
jgi:hypothetical protein